jgi:hypothetical protein
VGRATEQAKQGVWRPRSHDRGRLGWDGIGAQLLGIAGIAFFLCATPGREPPLWLKVASLVGVAVLVGGSLVEARWPRRSIGTDPRARTTSRFTLPDEDETRSISRASD